jgi:predicted RNA-binding Zn ribbon-like protein
MSETRDAEIHHLIGNNLCINFANTLYGHVGTPIHEYLFDYRDLVLWSRHAEILREQEAGSLLEEAELHPAEAQTVFQHAIELRETFYRVFANIAHARQLASDDLNRIHTAWKEDLNHSYLVRRSGGYALDWVPEPLLDRMLWPVTASAMELLTGDALGRVKQCGGCDWLFFDQSRNHMRRWCSMDKCGNRLKMQRRYARKKMQKRAQT